MQEWKADIRPSGCQSVHFSKHDRGASSDIFLASSRLNWLKYCSYSPMCLLDLANPLFWIVALVVPTFSVRLDRKRPHFASCLYVNLFSPLANNFPFYSVFLYKPYTSCFSSVP